MKKSSFVLALAALALVGGGCASDSVTNINVDGSGQADSGRSKAPVGYAETGANLLDGKDDYSAYTFTSTGGDCSTLGVPSTLTYALDPDLGYFVMVDLDGTYRDDLVSATPSTVSFNELAVAGQSADCAISVSFGDNNGNLGCGVAGADFYHPQPLCSGTVSVTATPR